MSTKEVNIGWLEHEFDFSLHFSRFICGGPALTDCRSVSRKRLALAYIGLAGNDVLANYLHDSIKRYRRAVNIFAESSTLDAGVLCKANAQFWQQGKIFGAIRKSQNWVGGTVDKPKYLPPSPEGLPSLMNEFYNQFNSDRNYDLAFITYLYTKILAIHPFVEGNGRTARALLEVMMSRSSMLPIHLSLFRVGADPIHYQQCLKESRGNSYSSAEHSYWCLASSWCNELYTYTERNIIHVKNELSNNLAMNVIDENTSIILKSLWHTPITSTKFLVQHTGLSIRCINESINFLCDRKILSISRKKDYPNDIIYVCNCILEALNKIDLMIFKNKESVK